MKKYFFNLLALIWLSSCGESFLDIKPEKSLTVPSTTGDLIALLDNEIVFSRNSVPIHGEVSSDDYFLEDLDWKTLTSEMHRNRYMWKSDFYGSIETDISWNLCYQAVFYANVVLERIASHPESALKNQITGSALFLRAWHHYWILNLYAKQYDANSASSDIGVPIRLESDINLPSQRLSVEETYKLIKEDLIKAIDLLPGIPQISTRPSKKACLALLARISIQQMDFSNALKYAEQALEIQDELINYADIDVSVAFPFERFNKEVVFYSYFYAQPFNTARFQINKNLFETYENDDLRKELFFFLNGNHLTFRGSYDGSDYLFCGLANDELFLIKSECLVRDGRIQEGLKILAYFLSTRYRNFDNKALLSQQNADVALKSVLQERRKQLLFRGIRWFDLKRLNREENHRTVLVRNIEGKMYRLEPNDEAYVLPIPPDVKKLSTY